MIYDKLAIDDMGRFERAEFINALTGPKAVYLIGSRHEEGHENLALFSSIVHIGANPPLIGIVFRPDTVRRHTLENIRNNKLFTINSVHPEFIDRAHQTSANYDEHTNEFDAVGLDKFYLDGIDVPFVKASALNLLVSYQEEYPIKSNGTHLVIGSIEKVSVDKALVAEDGWVDIFAIKSAVCVGLSRYGEATFLQKQDYARP